MIKVNGMNQRLIEKRNISFIYTKQFQSYIQFFIVSRKMQENEELIKLLIAQIILIDFVARFLLYFLDLLRIHTAYKYLNILIVL